MKMTIVILVSVNPLTLELSPPLLNWVLITRSVVTTCERVHVYVCVYTLSFCKGVIVEIGLHLKSSIFFNCQLGKICSSIYILVLYLFSVIMHLLMTILYL